MATVEVFSLLESIVLPFLCRSGKLQPKMLSVVSKKDDKNAVNGQLEQFLWGHH